MHTVKLSVECLEQRLTPSTYKKSNVAYGSSPAQTMDIYSNTSYTNAPIVVLVHGGRWAAGNKNSVEDQYARYFLNQGFVVVAADYRLVTPNGQGGYSNQFPIPVEDVASAISWVQSHASQFGANPNEVVLQGTSAGAQIASLLAYDPTGFNNWGLASPLHIAAFIGDSGIYNYSLIPANRDSTIAQYLGAYNGSPSWNVAQAISFAGPGKPPSLLIDGTGDSKSNYQNSSTLADALKAAGDVVTYDLYPGYQHGQFSKRFDTSTTEQSAVTAFLHAIGL